MLIENLLSCDFIQAFIKGKCEEGGCGVEISNRIASKDLLIIKPDEYYNSLHLKDTPPSPDCLIVVRCANGDYKIYIVELKDITIKESFDKKNVKDKFSTCLNHFMSDLLRKYFFADNVIISKLFLVFVADPFGQANTEEHRRLGKSTKIDALLALSAGEPFLFDGRRWCIQHSWQNPLIQPC